MAAVLVFTIVIFIEFSFGLMYVGIEECRVRTKVKYELLTKRFILLHCVGHTFSTILCSNVKCR